MGRAGSTRRRGQALVEFALVIPIFFTLLIGLIEFSLIMNAQLSINFATREAALIGAEAGNSVGADCAILQTIESSVTAPASSGLITEVRIYRSDTVGRPVPLGGPQVNTYRRTGSTACPRPGNPTATVGFSLFGAAGYPEIGRCNTIHAVAYAGGWQWVRTAATAPNWTQAAWLRSDDGGHAFVELAEASGLSKTDPDRPSF